MRSVPIIHRFNFASIFARGIANRSRDNAMSLPRRPTRFSNGGSIFAWNGFTVGPGHEQFHHCLILVQVRQRRRRNGFAKFFRHHFRIGVADAESYQSPDVSEHRLPDRFGKLINVLVRQREAEPVFARLRQNGSERIRREVLKLVNKQNLKRGTLAWSLNESKYLKNQDAILVFSS